jgi:hypothetical protein
MNTTPDFVEKYKSSRARGYRLEISKWETDRLRRELFRFKELRDTYSKGYYPAYMDDLGDDHLMYPTAAKLRGYLNEIDRRESLVLSELEKRHD